jgi:magnesium-protoporphyrin O-methyltransferase
VGCCPGSTSGGIFGERTAARDARRYRRKGLRSTARDVVDAVGGAGSVLEIGGGIGDLALELVRAGAAHATVVELSPAYRPEAERLAAELGLSERLSYVVADVAGGDAVEPADAVVLHRVVCCYPDGEGLTRAAARLARRSLALTLPRDSWWTRAGGHLVNVLLRLTGQELRFRVHPVAAIVAAAEAEGLRRGPGRRGGIWELLVLERPPAPG